LKNGGRASENGARFFAEKFKKCLILLRKSGM
jgi:hypothetical protein